VIPWLIIAVVAVPVLVIAFAAVRRTTPVNARPADPAAQARAEEEFAAAEAYEEQWREEDKKRFHEERLP
jgi:hypothetical protein